MGGTFLIRKISPLLRTVPWEQGGLLLYFFARKAASWLIFPMRPGRVCVVAVPTAYIFVCTKRRGGARELTGLKTAAKGGAGEERRRKGRGGKEREEKAKDSSAPEGRKKTSDSLIVGPASPPASIS